MSDIVMPVFIEKGDEELLRESGRSVSILSSVLMNIKRLENIGNINICSNSEDVVKAAKIRGISAYYAQKVRCDNVFDSNIFNSCKVMAENDALIEADVIFVGWRNLLLRQETISCALDTYRKGEFPILTSIRMTDKDPAFSFIPVKTVYIECFKEGESVSSQGGGAIYSYDKGVVTLQLNSNILQRGKDYYLSFTMLDEKERWSSNIGRLKFSIPAGVQDVSLRYSTTWLTDGKTSPAYVNIGFSSDVGKKCNPKLVIAIDISNVLPEQSFSVMISEEVGIEECDAMVQATTEPLYCVDTAKGVVFNRQKGIYVIGRQDCSDIYELGGAFTIIKREIIRRIMSSGYDGDIYGYVIHKPDDFELFNSIDLVKHIMLCNRQDSITQVSNERCELL